MPRPSRAASRQPGKYKEESESSDSDEWDDEEDPDNMNVPGGGTNIGVLKGDENVVKKEGGGSSLGRGGTLGELSSLGASSSGLSLQSLLGPPQPDLKPKADLLSTALSSSGLEGMAGTGGLQNRAALQQQLLQRGLVTKAGYPPGYQLLRSDAHLQPRDVPVSMAGLGLGYSPALSAGKPLLVISNNAQCASL
ncbi:hypothetical protein Pcinc_028430 [Petrolisthes cinctipes]|uniref:Uncharacterized protein n=1 Tax=Petrolisthes cinctipes TaxID=88211 RepID=A0AAE1K5E0_PETCI|nr:hypothetical protein Pcinc_028430 [Petrolisthes cinctipes]